MKRIVSMWTYLRLVRVDVGDVQVVVGLGAVTYGVAQVSAPAAWITLGALLLAGWIAPRFPRASKE